MQARMHACLAPSSDLLIFTPPPSFTAPLPLPRCTCSTMLSARSVSTVLRTAIRTAVTPSVRQFHQDEGQESYIKREGMLVHSAGLVPTQLSAHECMSMRCRTCSRSLLRGCSLTYRTGGNTLRLYPLFTCRDVCLRAEIPTTAKSGGSKAAVPAVAIVFICIVAGCLIGAGAMYLVRGKSKVRSLVRTRLSCCVFEAGEQKEAKAAGIALHPSLVHNSGLRTAALPLFPHPDACSPAMAFRYAWT